MDIEPLIAQRFKHLMNCPWADYPKSMNMFENYIYKLRQVVEAGEPFTIWSWPYSPHAVAEYGYRLNEYCSNDVSEGTVENLITEELNKRGLAHSTVMENTEPVAIPSGTYHIYGLLAPVVIEEELLPCDEFLGHPIYRYGSHAFTIESVKVKEDAPVNNVGGGNIAGVSPGQEPPGKRGLYFARNLKKTKELNKKLKRKL